MNRIYYAIIIIILFMAGCAPTTAQQLRSNPAGVYTFTVDRDSQAVYQKVLSHAQGCSRIGAFGENAVVQAETAPGGMRSSISITNSKAFAVSTIFMIDIEQLGDNMTEVKVFYALHRYGPTALLIEDWIKKDSNDCTRGKVVPECAC